MQEDMARRREEEARRQREEDFLRSSLRGSEKLKALEEARTPSPAVVSNDGSTVKGAVNSAFAMDDDAEVPNERHRTSNRVAYRDDLGRVVGKCACRFLYYFSFH